MTERLSDYDYELPEALIAVTPAERRDASRLLCLDRRTGAVRHRTFQAITDMFRSGDVLVVNDARVIPARLAAVRDTGGRVEVLLVRPDETARGAWVAMMNAGGRLRKGERLRVTGSDASICLVDRRDGGYWIVAADRPMADVMAAGVLPLPPYIVKERRRRDMPEEMPELDRERYQTVYADAPGAVAAPTAGLHFTGRMLDDLRARGVDVRRLALFVGPGTFRPVKVDDISEHRIEPERYHLPADTADAVRRACEDGRRVVATGTTCCRVLEYVVRHADWTEHDGWTDLFIRPPWEFEVVGALITNFHLPRSTLLMLVSAFAGRRNVLAAYAEAVRERYRFYSYGDATFIA